ncbi:HelD family protein [Adlercreutzia sp. ZJ141]|uniref:HelD family protein n=1 Tax=Adlercreutzia sp. ZJ141 TaxID=2709406 RepID=UPI0013EBDB92|nr:ATP-binding domain-containing protein [Adlercreutzia sp. ZJ141]
MSTSVTAPQPTEQTDPVFEHEQRHLTKTYEKLKAIARDAQRKLEETARAAAADKESMTADIAHNFTTDDEAMETYAAIAAVNRIIEGYNISQEVNSQRLADAQLLLRQPYFAKISLQFKPDEDPKELYIGNAGMSDENCKRLVVDWRSPVAEVYYNQENGATSYVANGRTINVDLLLRRQFDISENVLAAYFDTNVAIQDSLLLASLSKQRTAQMQAITATIQKEQNVIVRHDDVDALLVHGIAGSGKTSVLLQRIAYLFYQNRDTLRPDEVHLITPNPVFGHYIDNVLPDMGEQNPHIETWADLAESLMPQGRGHERSHATTADLAALDRGMRELVLDHGDFKEITCEGTRFVSVGQIQQAIGKFKNVPIGPHRITLAREELLKRVRSRIAQLAATERAQDELLELSTDEQLELFRETIEPQTEAELKSYTLRYLNTKYAGAIEAVERDEWLRIDRIGMRILDAQGLDPVTWLYTKICLTGLGDTSAKYVMIDEVQDYTAAQLAVFARYFRYAHFLLLGDAHQAIKEETATFDEIRQVFERERGSVTSCSLMTSYRSSPEITNLFASLLPQDEQAHVSSVQPEHTSPSIEVCTTENERIARIAAIIIEAGDQAGLAAIITPDSNQARLLHAALLPALGEKTPRVMDTTMTLPDDGVVIVPLKLAKGLEFDCVIVPDASARVFGEDELSRNRLYTTISRATHHLHIVSSEPLTPLLQRCGA